jgi:hypothetical protein
MAINKNIEVYSLDDIDELTNEPLVKDKYSISVTDHISDEKLNSYAKQMSGEVVSYKLSKEELERLDQRLKKKRSVYLGKLN